jgi:hypothetical protein
MSTKSKLRRGKRKLRNYLIFGEYQLHYAGYMALVSAVLTGGLGWLVYHFQKVAARVVDVRALDPTDVEAQVLSAAFHRSDRHLLIGLIIFGVLLAAVLFAWQIVTTNRVAGPLYYIAHQTRRMRAGYLGTLHPLRKSDMLHGFFETFRKMHDAMRERARREADQFTRLAELAAKAGQTEVEAELRMLAQQRLESLKDRPGFGLTSGMVSARERPSLNGSLDG